MSTLGWVITFGLTFVAYKLARIVVRVLFDMYKGDARRLKLSYLDKKGHRVSTIVELDDDLEALIDDIRHNQTDKSGAPAP